MPASLADHPDGMQVNPRPAPLLRDTHLWEATRGAFTAGARERKGPLVVSLTPAYAGAFLEDGSSVRRQLAAIAPIVARSLAVQRRRGRAGQVVLLAPSAWLRLAWPSQAQGDRAQQIAGLARHLESVIGDALARLPVDAVVLGAHYVAPASPRSDFDGVFVFDVERLQMTWAGAAIAHGAAGPKLARDAERDSLAHVPGLGPTLLLNDHELVSLVRADDPTSAHVLDAARRMGAQHALHLGYGAGPAGLWATRLAKLAALLPALRGWASVSRVTAAEPRDGWRGLVGGVDHLPLTVRLAGEGR